MAELAAFEACFELIAILFKVSISFAMCAVFWCIRVVMMWSVQVVIMIIVLGDNIVIVVVVLVVFICFSLVVVG